MSLRSFLTISCSTLTLLNITCSSLAQTPSPLNANSLVKAASLAVAQKDISKARSFLREALQKDPNCSKAMFNLGVLDSAELKFGDAITMFNQFLSVQPTGVWADRAKREIETATVLKATPAGTDGPFVALLGLASKAMATGRLQLASDAVSKAIRTKPDDWRGYSAGASLALLMKKKPQAVSLLEIARQKCSSDAEKAKIAKAIADLRSGSQS